MSEDIRLSLHPCGDGWVCCDGNCADCHRILGCPVVYSDRTNPTEHPPTPATDTPSDDFIKDTYENIKKTAAIQAEQAALKSLIDELRRLNELIQETTEKIREVVIPIPPGTPEDTIKKIDRICRHNKRKGRKKKRG
ncbi:MAG: hypothetical protein IJK23_09840 [Clostridia bacterium]|nr:hypothetical protein [Clostridia bacterium]